MESDHDSQRLFERKKMMETASEEERCIHQMIKGTCSICDGQTNQKMLSGVFDEVNAETISEDDGTPSSSATVLTKVCQKAGCSHGGSFQGMDRFEDGQDICKDCRPGSVNDLIREKNEENVKKRKNFRWSKEDGYFLRQSVDRMTNRELGDHLGRSPGAVGVHLNTLGILRKKKSKKVKGVKKVEKKADFDAEKFYLGKLCKDDHEHGDSGKSLRRKSSRSCMECNKYSRTQLSESQIIVDFTDHPDLLEALKNSAKESLRDLDKELLWVIKRLVAAGKLTDGVSED